MSSHPRLFARGHRTVPAPLGAQLRVMIYSASPGRISFLHQELARGVVIQVARNVDDVIASLVDDPPPRPQVFVVDLDAISPGELLHLHALRERGWCGMIVGIGHAPEELRRSLGIEHLLAFPLPPHALREAVGAIGFEAQTVPMPVLALDPT